MIELRDAIRCFGGRRVVGPITTVLRTGEVTMLVGENGAGKTTTLELILGVFPPTSGNVLVNGLESFKASAETKRLFGYVPYEGVVTDWLTGREYIHLVASLYGTSPADADARIDALLDRFDLADRIDDLLATYSSGMRKKIAILAVLAHGPRYLVLDEPFNGLDPFAVRALSQLFRELAASGTGILVSTHTLALADSLADRVLVLADGRLVLDASIADVRGRGGLEAILLGSIPSLASRAA